VDSEKTKLLLVSDFNIDTFGGYLANNEDWPPVATESAPYGQVQPTLLKAAEGGFGTACDIVFVWTRPQTVADAFDRLANGLDTRLDEILGQVDNFSALLLGAAKSFRVLLVPSWVYPQNPRGAGPLEFEEGCGIAYTLMRMNIRLAENLRKAANIRLLNSQPWIETAGRSRAYNPKLWYLGKIAFGNEVFMEAVADVKALLSCLAGKSRKLVLLDLDDTLWGGIVGDAGWENLLLGGHSHIGEAFADFQRALKVLNRKGVLLGIISKNDEITALDAIRRHPEMVLKMEDFCGWRINWQDKAHNVVELTAELNLGLQSVVFIDDNPAERARVAEALPEVLVPEWPRDKMLYTQALLELRCFDTVSVSTEDRSRAEMYRIEQRREQEKNSVGSIEEWLAGLNMQVKIERLNSGNVKRTAQLFNKTNQMNLSTRRLSQDELWKWAHDENHRLWAFRVSDRFGDSGLTGIVSMSVKNERGRVEDFILSCRVMGRRIEEVLLSSVVEEARSLGLDRVTLKYLPTKKNKPCLDFLEQSPLSFSDEYGVFYWNCNRPFTPPGFIELNRSTAE
jgi:FkbH-like protein